MAVAKLYPERPQAQRGKSGAYISTGDDPANQAHEVRLVADTYLYRARSVLACLPEAADAVLADTVSLTDAYAQAVKLRDDRNSDQVRLQLLCERAPELADLVDEGRMALAEAESACQTRQETIRRRQHRARELLNGLERMVDVLADHKRRAAVCARVRRARARPRPGGRRRALDYWDADAQTARPPGVGREPSICVPPRENAAQYAVVATRRRSARRPSRNAVRCGLSLRNSKPQFPENVLKLTT
jgi:hypothetical protein